MAPFSRSPPPRTTRATSPRCGLWVLLVLRASSSSALQPTTRRAFGAGAAATAGSSLVGASPAVAAAPAATAPPPALEIPSAIMPSWTMIVPVVELDAAVATWTAQATEGAYGPVAQALEQLNKGGILSAKNFYLGIGSKYAATLVYDDFDKGLVEADKQVRVSSMVLAANALDAAKKSLSSEFPSDSAKNLKAAGDRLGDFLARVPRKDLERARGAIANFYAADANRDGVVDEAEFYKAGVLTQEEQLAATWGVWGTTLYQKDLRPLTPSTVYLEIRNPPPIPDALKRAIARSEF